MSSLVRPVPAHLDADAELFWAATRDRRLAYQVCDACTSVVFYPRNHCTGCTSTRLRLSYSMGLGAIYTRTVVRRHTNPFFRQRTPYVVALVDLDEGFRMLAEVISDRPEDVRIGARAAVEWETCGDRNVPLFRVVE